MANSHQVKSPLALGSLGGSTEAADYDLELQGFPICWVLICEYSREAFVTAPHFTNEWLVGLANLLHCVSCFLFYWHVDGAIGGLFFPPTFNRLYRPIRRLVELSVSSRGICSYEWLVRVEWSLPIGSEAGAFLLTASKGHHSFN